MRSRAASGTHAACREQAVTLLVESVCPLAAAKRKTRFTSAQRVGRRLWPHPRSSSIELAM